jgi:hypothetical protein
MKKAALLVPSLATVVAMACFTGGCQSGAEMPPEPLVGAWRGPAQFSSGPYAEVKDLELMYVFHADGTMTESSNYDGAPPVPPAYGAWKRTGPRQYEAHYEFYAVKPPASLDEIPKGGGWGPDGRGVLTQRITLSDDGRTFESTIRMEVFDKLGKPAAGSGSAVARAQPMRP